MQGSNPAALLRPAIAILAALLLALTQREAEAIMAGQLPDTPAARVDANTEASAWNSAVSVIVNGLPYSGVVIAPRFVLTAAHVAGGAAPASVQVRVNTSAGGTVLAANAVHRFPTANFPYDDLTIVELAQAVPAAVKIPLIHRQAPTAAMQITLVGYGGSAQGNNGSNAVGASASVKRSGRNALDLTFTYFGTDTLRSSFYAFDFDGPSGSGSLGGATLGNTVETELVSGDSGSPAYATVDGQLVLVGINTFLMAAPGSTTTGSTFGNLGGGILLSDSRFYDWIVLVTGNTVAGAESGDVPLPGWALTLLGVGLGRSMVRRLRTPALR